MPLKEFENMVDKMQLVFESSLNLGQYIDAAKILYNMNELLPDDLQLVFDDVDESSMRSFVHQYSAEIKLAISEYKQRLT